MYLIELSLTPTLDSVYMGLNRMGVGLLKYEKGIWYAMGEVGLEEDWRVIKDPDQYLWFNNPVTIIRKDNNE